MVAGPVSSQERALRPAQLHRHPNALTPGTTGYRTHVTRSTTAHRWPCTRSLQPLRRDPRLVCDVQGEAGGRGSTAKSLKKSLKTQDDAGLDGIGPADGGSGPLNLPRILSHLGGSGDWLSTLGHLAKPPAGLNLDARVTAESPHLAAPGRRQDDKSVTLASYPHRRGYGLTRAAVRRQQNESLLGQGQQPVHTRNTNQRSASGMAGLGWVCDGAWHRIPLRRS